MLSRRFPRSVSDQATGSVWRWGCYSGLIALAVLAGVAGLFIRDGIRIRDDLQAGERQLAHSQLTSLDSRASVERTFGSADRKLRRGASLARNSPWFQIMDVFPGGRTQRRAIRDLSSAAARAGDIAYDAARNARSALDRPTAAPTDRLRLIDNLRTQLSIADSRLKQINPGARGRLITPLAHARQRFLADLTKAHRQLTDGLDQTGALRSLLAGPRRYLVLAGNNAEMRSGGITTVTSAASIEGGDVRVGRFIQSENLLLPDGKGVPVPPDLVHLYQWISVGQEWRTTETSPNWPIVASIYAQMAARSPIGPVDGVIFVDMVTLRSLLDVVGPVNVNGVTYTADNVYDELLYRNYLRFSTGAEANARHEAQSEVAAAIFEVLRTRPFSLARLAHELSHNAKGRHVLAWSSHPDEEAMWVKSGASGALCANCFMISPQNVSASKLDYFIDPRAAMRVEHYSEHQEVNLVLTPAYARLPNSQPWLDTECLQLYASEADESVTLDEVRQALSKIPGSLTEDFVAERDEP